ncbi:MAG: hypothetical protein M3487_00685 [Actinomycetota bacterium]|nr:hypothetical protein [Actinomycetota bacterium]
MTPQPPDEQGSVLPPPSSTPAAASTPSAEGIDPQSTARGAAGNGGQATGEKAGGQSSTETSKAAETVQTAKDGARDVAVTATDQAKAVAGQARQQAGRVVDQAGSEIKERAREQSDRAASGLRTLSGQAAALADGRPEEAGPLGDYLREAQTKVQQVAERLEARGPEGVLDDMTDFARRRPGLFLLGAAGVGFLAGRLVRSGAAASNDDAESGGTGNGDVTAAPLAMPREERSRTTLDEPTHLGMPA